MTAVHWAALRVAHSAVTMVGARVGKLACLKVDHWAAKLDASSVDSKVDNSAGQTAVSLVALLGRLWVECWVYWKVVKKVAQMAELTVERLVGNWVALRAVQTVARWDCYSVVQTDTWTAGPRADWTAVWKA